MAISISTLTANTGTSDPQSTASISPAAGSALLVTVGLSFSSGTPADSLSPSGLGGTWTKLATGHYGIRRRAWLYLVEGVSGTGALSFDYTGAGTPQEWGWIVEQVTGHDTTTPTASPAVANTEASTSMTVASGGSADAGDVTYSSLCLESNIDASPEAGWDGLGATTTGSLGVRRVESAWDDAADLSHTWTWGGSTQGNAAFIVIVNVGSSTTPVGKEASLRWHARAALGDAADVRWQTRAAMGDPLGLVWAARTFVGDPVSLPWHVRSFVGDPSEFRWDLAAQVGDAADLRWGVGGQAGKDLEAIWHQRSVLGDPADLRWDVRTPMGDPASFVWDLRAALGDPTDLRWHSREAVGDPVDLRWGVGGVVGDEMALRWMILTALGDPLSLLWNVSTAAPIGDPLDLRWHTRNLVGDPASFRWNLQATVGDDASLRWHARQAQGDPLAVRWNVRTGVFDVLTLPWHVRTFLGDEIGLVWTLYAALADDLLLAWNTAGTNAELARAQLWLANQRNIIQKRRRVARMLESPSGVASDLLARTLPRIVTNPPDDDETERIPGSLPGDPDAYNALLERTRALKRDH